MVRWKSAWILWVNSASQKNKCVVLYVQEKNCCVNFFHINNYWGCVPEYYLTVRVPVREIWMRRLFAAGQCSSSCVNEYHEFPTGNFQWAFDFHQLVASLQPWLKPAGLFSVGLLKSCLYDRTVESWRTERQYRMGDWKYWSKTLKHVFLHLMKRCRTCKANFGGHFQHLL